MPHAIRLSTGTYENFRTQTVTEALRAMAPETVVVPKVSRLQSPVLPEGVSPVLAAYADGASTVAWERGTLDPDELLCALPSLFGSAADLETERARLFDMADLFLADDLPHLLRIASDLGAGSAVGEMAARLPLDRSAVVGHAHDWAFTAARNAIIPIYGAACAAVGGRAPNPAWRLLGGLDGLEHGIRHLRDVEGPFWEGKARPSDDLDDPWVARRLLEFDQDAEGVRLKVLIQAARAFGQASTMVALARRLAGEDAPFRAKEVLEHLARDQTPAAPAFR